MQRLANYINGEFCLAQSGDWLDSVEPATGRVFAQFPDSDDRDVESAVEAANAAEAVWRATTARQRSDILLRIADMIEADLDDLAHAEAQDTGKPLRLAREVDIPRAVANFRFFATAILHFDSEFHQTDQLAINYTLRHPVGVAALISPWNLPLYLLSWKVAPALAAGCTAVAKPSELAPLTASRLAGYADAAGLPNGVLNLVHGLGPKVGAPLVSSPHVSAISFTGGTETGAKIGRAAAGSFKRLTLELGGRNANIVFGDADFEASVATSVRAAFQNQGQMCLSGSRIFVQRDIYARFVDEFTRRTQALKVGDPLEPGTDQGAVVSAEHLRRVESFLDQARQQGGTILCGGRPPESLPPRCQGGYFLEPAVVVDLPADAPFNCQEVFGPVVSIMPFSDTADAVDWANLTPYGLSASLWTNDLRLAHRVAGALRTGTVWINCWLLRDLRVPFGGAKHSGIGREGGWEALRFFTEPKNVCVAMTDPAGS
jgi:aminomuconate-semialdehyde/2-hydroxymuconate-6-semialdehyde dehydrogenase